MEGMECEESLPTSDPSLSLVITPYPSSGEVLTVFVTFIDIEEEESLSMCFGNFTGSAGNRLPLAMVFIMVNGGCKLSDATHPIYDVVFVVSEDT
jgi:hypothetical protein